MWSDALLLALHYLISVIPPTVIGMVLMELLIGLGWIHKLDFVTAPFMRFAHLREEIGMSFIASFGSPTAGNSMVADLNRKGLIDSKETIIASLINSFPSTIVLLRNLLPVLIILLGTTGIIYFAIVVSVGLLRTAITLLIGRILLRPKNGNVQKKGAVKKKLKNAFMDALRASWIPLRRIIPVMTISAIIVFQLIDAGFFDTISLYLKDVSALSYLPGEGLPVIAAWFASNIAAYTIAGSLLDEGILSSKETVIILLAGRVLSSITRIRFTIPYYTGIFSPKLGMQIMLLSSLMQDGIMVIVIVLLALFW
ncbi:MAG: nucleoside recognition protein [Candidatus Methanoperedens sp.]|nr:nucleoside recognition protein [Candidatus Methanoperedens sp.]